MATLCDYFAKDFAASLRWNHNVSLKNDIFNTSVLVCVGQEMYSKAIFIAYYVPHNKCNFEINSKLLTALDEILLKYNSIIQIDSGFINDIKLGKCGSQFSVFSRKVYLYLENDLSPPELVALDSLAKNNNLCVTIRGINYVKKKMELEKPLAFISYDSRNRNFAEALAIELQKKLCPVWFDEFSLKIGDNLRESIEKGIKAAKKCILLLTPEFISNIGWPKKEYDIALLKEIIEKADSSILPVWYEVSSKDVYGYSPILAGKHALIWNEQEKEKNIIKLYKAILS